MSTISVTSNIIVTGGPSLGFTSSFDVEAYDLVDLVIHGGDTDIEANLQPGGAVQILAVGTDWQSDPHAPKGKLSFRVSKDEKAAVFKLDEPILFAGGSLSAFGANEPKSLFLSNTTAGVDKRDAQVRILVARDATP